MAEGGDVGAPGAALAPCATPWTIGEGENKPRALVGDDEDCPVVRAACTSGGPERLT